MPGRLGQQPNSGQQSLQGTLRPDAQAPQRGGGGIGAVGVLRYQARQQLGPRRPGPRAELGPQGNGLLEGVERDRESRAREGGKLE